MSAFTVAEEFVTCLETAFDGDTGAPARICQRPGDQVPFLFGVGVDECCAGLAWVRVQSIAPVTDPEQANDPDFNSCTDSRRMITLELGVVRCNPSGVDVSCEAWTALAARMDLDYRAMQRAVCCAVTSLVNDDSDVYRIRPGTWEPLESNGGCAGGSMPVTVWTDCTDC